VRYTAHYLVTPNERLRELARADEDLVLLCEPFLVTSEEGGLRAMTTKDEYALRVKIFVLLHFTNEYLATVKSLELLFEGRQIDQELFDSWWQLIPAGDAEPMPTFGEKYKVTNVPRSRVGPTNSDAVDEWLARVAEF
jgi:hypothetical protein